LEQQARGRQRRFVRVEKPPAPQVELMQLQPVPVPVPAVALALIKIRALPVSPAANASAWAARGEEVEEEGLTERRVNTSQNKNKQQKCHAKTPKTSMHPCSDTQPPQHTLPSLPLHLSLPSSLPLHSLRQRWPGQAQCEQELDALEQRRLTKFLENQRL
jgi:hypothetical protein